MASAVAAERPAFRTHRDVRRNRQADRPPLYSGRIAADHATRFQAAHALVDGRPGEMDALREALDALAPVRSQRRQDREIRGIKVAFDVLAEHLTTPRNLF